MDYSSNLQLSLEKVLEKVKQNCYCYIKNHDFLPFFPVFKRLLRHLSNASLTWVRPFSGEKAGENKAKVKVNHIPCFMPF